MTALDELHGIPLFEDVPEEALREVVRRGLEKFVPAGEVNGREGEPVDHLYVILEGELRITKQATGGEVVINTYTPGLGLDVSYRIVVGRHGGDIHVVSEPGRTRFEVRLPVGGPGEADATRDLKIEAEA